MPKSKTIQLSHYLSDGMPQLSDFEQVVVDIPQPEEGQVLVKNLYLSVDPYMRGRMIDRKSYIPPFALNHPLEGGAVGVVEASGDARYTPGDMVSSFHGWREYFIASGDTLEKLNTNQQDLPYYLGALGMPGMTAYAGLLSIGKPQAGETVFVSAATGAVGSIVCQIAKLKGCKVIASAGSLEKVQWLQQALQVDVAFNYKECTSISKRLQDSAPQGIDIYFDNVGGEHLQAAINSMNLHGRIVMCGMISEYNNAHPKAGPNNLMQIIGKRLMLQGFIVSDFIAQKPQFYQDMSHWIHSGDIKVKQSILDGIENIPQAFINLFTGENFGKMLIKL